MIGKPYLMTYPDGTAQWFVTRLVYVGVPDRWPRDFKLPRTDEEVDD